MPFTSIDLADLLPGEPITSAQGMAFYQNTIAVAEGDEDAPRVAIKTLGGSVASSGNLDFTGLDDGYLGCVIDGHFKSDGASRTLAVALSTDGATFATASTAITDNAGNATSFKIVIDFATGAMKVTHHANAGPVYATATLAGASVDVQAVRLIAGTTVGISAILTGTGGEAIA